MEIDALVARAKFAQRYRCTQPRFDQELMLEQARHPLLLFGDREVTPIDLRIPSGKHVLVITGPNTGGKTVALKTLGLMALMAQSGMLIPAAEGARLPCFRGDLRRHRRRAEPRAQPLDVLGARGESDRDHRAAMRRAPALVLLDEPGVGTDPEDGAALGIGMIQILEARRRPRRAQHALRAR